MPVPHILAGTAGGTTAQLDANYAYLSALRDLFSVVGVNVGLGATVSPTWDATGRALQLGPSTALYNPGSGSHSILATNLVYELGATSAKLVNAATAAAYSQDNGRHRFYVAPAGLAGAVALLKEALQLDNAGNAIFVNPPSAPPALAANGDLTINPTSNTNLRFSYRGSDGVTRVGNITLA